MSCASAQMRREPARDKASREERPGSPHVTHVLLLDCCRLGNTVNASAALLVLDAQT
ncbi:hypothetical protein BN2476_250152 [Paraburkholderia piptadeniae]|uniref:Uncharacterized protein n=1 Tax=Paraburkholderia piptadeniae TaxID=1701573 RepID=A0A1N7S0U3_9BURK|nr:hypothetical protein BN2476_250152 [Paraburkholderia piptadeniae]